MPLKPNNNAPTLRRAITTPRLKRSTAGGPGAQPGPMQQAGQPGLVGGPPQTGSPLGAQPQRTGLGGPMQQAGNPGLASGPRPQRPLNAGGQVRPNTQVRQGGQARTSAGAEPRYAYSSNTAMAKSRSFGDVIPSENRAMAKSRSFGDVIPSENRAAAEAMRADFQRSNQLRPGGVGMNVQREAPVMRRAAAADGTPPVASTSSGLKSGGGAQKQAGEQDEQEEGGAQQSSVESDLSYLDGAVDFKHDNAARPYRALGYNSWSEVFEAARNGELPEGYQINPKEIIERARRVRDIRRGAELDGLDPARQEWLDNLPASYYVDEEGNIYNQRGGVPQQAVPLGNIYSDPTTWDQGLQDRFYAQTDAENPAVNIQDMLEQSEADFREQQGVYDERLQERMDAARVQQAMQKAQAHRALMERASRSGMSPTQLTGQLGQIAQGAAADTFQTESDAALKQAEVALQGRIQANQQKYNILRMQFQDALQQGDQIRSQRLQQQMAQYQAAISKDMMEYQWRLNNRVTGADIGGALLGLGTGAATSAIGGYFGGLGMGA